MTSVLVGALLSYVDVATFFGFSADTVPELAKDIGGIQRPVVASPKGGASFDIGRVTVRDRARIPLQAVRPLLLRTTLQEAEDFGDSLGLTKAADRRLRKVSSRGAGSPLVFVDAREFPDGYRIAGLYVVERGSVSVRFRIFRGSEKGGAIAVEGSIDDPEALFAAIVDAAMKAID